MKTSTKFTIQLNDEEMYFLRDLVRIGMKSKYYQEYSNEESGDIEYDDIKMEQILAARKFVQLLPVSDIDALFDEKLFEGVTV